MRPFGARGYDPLRAGGGRRSGLGGTAGPGRRGVVEQGELRLLLLSLVAEQARHGYELIRAVEEVSGGGYTPSPGVIYPALAAMEDLGHVVVHDRASGRKAFAVTAAGQAVLDAQPAELARVRARLAALGGGGLADNAPVVRAMNNLKAVLGPALARARPGRPHDIAALIDDAAQKIERLD